MCVKLKFGDTKLINLLNLQKLIDEKKQVHLFVIKCSEKGFIKKNNDGIEIFNQEKLAILSFDGNVLYGFNDKDEKINYQLSDFDLVTHVKYDYIRDKNCFFSHNEHILYFNSSILKNE